MKAAAIVGAVAALVVAGLALAPSAGIGLVAGPAEQRGLVLPTWERHGYLTSDTPGAVRAIADVGAGWVQIVPTWYQVSRTSTEIAPTDSSVADEDIRHMVDLARGAGLEVLLKPHVDVLDGSDRSVIDPNDREAWFRSYRAFIDHYADLANEMDVSQFAVGTELSTLSGDRQRWLTVINDVRKRYEGPLVYAANRFEYAGVPFWDAVDLIGVDGYWQLSSYPTADVSQLERAFAPIRDHLAALAARVGRRILFTEAGYPSQHGAATAPWNAAQSRRPAEDEQAAAYQALLATFTGQPWWAGVFWWTWEVHHRYRIDPTEDLDYSVRGKLAEAVLRRWWTRQDDRRSA